MKAVDLFFYSVLPFNDTNSDSFFVSSTSDNKIETFVTPKKSPRTRGGGTRRVRVRGGTGIQCNNKVISVKGVARPINATDREVIADDAVFNFNIHNHAAQGSMHNYCRVHSRGRVRNCGKGRNNSRYLPLSTCEKLIRMFLLI